MDAFEQHSVAAPAAVSIGIWPQLLPELAERIGNCLPRNERACTLRLVNRAAATLFRGPHHTTISLSQPVPPHAFAHRWGPPGATRGLPYRQRLQLLYLTAASGSIPNMEVALEAAGCLPTGEVFCAAAAAGQLEMCKWLLERGCPCDDALFDAAKAGQWQACEWLLANTDTPGLNNAHWAAARNGHVDLMKWLMRERPDICGLGRSRWERRQMFVAVAHGCDLATLQLLHREWLEVPAGAVESAGQEVGLAEEHEQEERDGGRAEDVVAAAASSPTPDWRAKVEWLEGHGYPRAPHACRHAAGCPDAVERLAWLRGRGYECDESASFASGDNLAALQYLHAEGALLDANSAARSAALSGNLSAVAWLLETPGVGVELNPPLFESAASSGSLELMAWLHERGCPWDENVFEAAADGGNELALEWLAERGCPFGESGEPFNYATSNWDEATLRCLKRLGCPDPRGRSRC